MSLHVASKEFGEERNIDKKKIYRSSEIIMRDRIIVSKRKAKIEKKVLKKYIFRKKGRRN